MGGERGQASRLSPVADWADAYVARVNAGTKFTHQFRAKDTGSLIDWVEIRS
jgi:hypothetical protein